jgi:hypothetical protein
MGRAAAFAAFALSGLACANPPPGALLDARSGYAEAERDPSVSRLASVQPRRSSPSSGPSGEDRGSC